MSGDYFDLLLARMSGEVPLVEPRIAPFVPPAVPLEFEDEETEALAVSRATPVVERVGPPTVETSSDVASFVPSVAFETTEHVERRTERVTDRISTEIHHHHSEQTVSLSEASESEAKPSSAPVAGVPVQQRATQPSVARVQARAVAPAAHPPAVRLEPPSKPAATSERELPPISVRIDRIEVRTTPPAKPERRTPQPSAGPRLITG